jgi:hypothetical protein
VPRVFAHTRGTEPPPTQHHGPFGASNDVAMK